MADTYQSFVMGYMAFWVILFVGFCILFMKTKKTESLLKDLEKYLE